MKKVVSIFAVALLTAGLFVSCESENNIEDSDALYNVEVEASTDGDHLVVTDRE